MIRRSIRRWVLLGYWSAMFVATHWPDLDRYKPEEGWPIPNLTLLAHVGIFAFWTSLWWWLLSAGGQTVSRAARTPPQGR